MNVEEYSNDFNHIQNMREKLGLSTQEGSLQ